MIAQRQTRSPRLLIAAALCAVGIGGLAAPGEAHARDAQRCVAGAITALGSVVPDTRAEETRQRPRVACSVAIERCERRLDRKRQRVGFSFPFARCEVLRREAADRGHGPRYAAPSVRCTAEAFTRRGRPLGNTRAAETRRVENRACRAALRQCEDRLDRKRRVSGRDLPFARCEVVRTRAARAERRRGPDELSLGPLRNRVFGYRTVTIDD